MKNDKMIVNRCGAGSVESAAAFAARPRVVGGPAPDEDIESVHTWSTEPALELTEFGPIAWWTCTRCPARTLHDPETDDGFAKEPIVVYPGSCFAEDELEPGRALLDPFQKLWIVARVGAAEDMAREEQDEIRVGGGGPLVALQSGAGGTLITRASRVREWTLLPRCPCPRRADGAAEHLQGCVGDAVQLDSAATMAMRFGGPLRPELVHMVHYPGRDEAEEDGAALVRAFRNTPREELRCWGDNDHPPADGDDGADWMPTSGGGWLCPAHYAEFDAERRSDTEPAPPSEALQRAMDTADEDVIPTARLPLLPADA